MLKILSFVSFLTGSSFGSFGILDVYNWTMGDESFPASCALLAVGYGFINIAFELNPRLSCPTHAY